MLYVQCSFIPGLTLLFFVIYYGKSIEYIQNSLCYIPVFAYLLIYIPTIKLRRRYVNMWLSSPVIKSSSFIYLNSSIRPAAIVESSRIIILCLQKKRRVNNRMLIQFVFMCTIFISTFFALFIGQHHTS